MPDHKHGHKTTVAIAGHGHALRVGYATHNILEIPPAPIAKHLARKCLPFAGAAVWVAIENGIASRRVVVADGIATNAKGGVRTTVDTHYQRVAHALTRPDGMDQPAVNLVAIHPLVNNTLGLAPGKLGH